MPFLSSLCTFLIVRLLSKQLKTVTKTCVLKPTHAPCTLICLRVIQGKWKTTAFCTQNTSFLVVQKTQRTVTCRMGKWFTDEPTSRWKAKNKRTAIVTCSSKQNKQGYDIWIPEYFNKYQIMFTSYKFAQ